MTTPEILEYVQQHPAAKVKVAVTDIDGVLRGKYISAAKFLSVADAGMGFCDVVFGWDMHDAAYDNVPFTGWHTGYPDAHVRIDMDTFRKIPWEDGLPFFLGDFTNADGAPAYPCPRQLLQTIRRQCEQAGFTPYFAQEFEWFNFMETPASLQAKNFHHLTPLTPGMFGYSVLRGALNKDYLSDLFELLRRFDVPLEGLHTETGPGVYEAAILYALLLEAADRAVLFKTAVKEIAYRHGIAATFMAKFSAALPGCSGHVHQSLWHAPSGRNLFHDLHDAQHMSALMKNYIAGQLYCLPHILPMIAPVVNSYKRLVEGAWAPTTLTWATDNRTVALRALPGSNASTRLETRVVGSDTNPYLAMAACLASGLYGITHQLPLQPATAGNGYLDAAHGTLPHDLNEATRQMKHSAVAKELFGEQFVAHFTLTREWEWRRFSGAVTDWELKRYFEII